MVDAWTAVLTGLFTGIGVEVAKVVHELFIEKRLRRVSEDLKKAATFQRFDFGELKPPRL